MTTRGHRTLTGTIWVLAITAPVRALRVAANRGWDWTSARFLPPPRFPEPLVTAAMRTIGDLPTARDVDAWKPEWSGLWLENPRRIIWAINRIEREGERHLGLPTDLACSLLYVHTGGVPPRDIAQIADSFETDETPEDYAMALDLVSAGFTVADSTAAFDARLRVAVAHEWMHRYGLDTLQACLRAGLSRDELKTVYETGVFPDPETLAALAALRESLA